MNKAMATSPGPPVAVAAGLTDVAKPAGVQVTRRHVANGLRVERQEAAGAALNRSPDTRSAAGRAGPTESRPLT
jgi:hypothetical protein